jgi:transposase InsO family protein
VFGKTSGADLRPAKRAPDAVGNAAPGFPAEQPPGAVAAGEHSGDVAWTGAGLLDGDRGPDFVRRDFTAGTPDPVWAGDMTEIVTGEAKLYPAAGIDLFPRRLLGYAMGERHDAELIVGAHSPSVCGVERR